MSKHCAPIKPFIPNFKAFFVLIGIALSCIRRSSFSATQQTGAYSVHCFIVRLPVGGHCPLVRDSEPIRLLEIPTSPSFYMLIGFIFGLLWSVTIDMIYSLDI